MMYAARCIQAQRSENQHWPSTSSGYIPSHVTLYRPICRVFSSHLLLGSRNNCACWVACLTCSVRPGQDSVTLTNTALVLWLRDQELHMGSQAQLAGHETQPTRPPPLRGVLEEFFSCRTTPSVAIPIHDICCTDQGSSATPGPGPTENYHPHALASAWNLEPLAVGPSNLNPLARIRQLIANMLLAITAGPRNVWFQLRRCISSSHIAQVHS